MSDPAIASARPPGANGNPPAPATRTAWPPKATKTALTFVGAAATGIAILGAFTAGWIDRPALFAMLIGGLVGSVELLGRYRHAPLRALLTGSGFFYVLVNVLAAWAAYYMIGVLKPFAAETDADARDLKHVLAAGFGSLVVLRSALFKIRVGESDVGIGPAAILDTLLLVADRGVDRREAVARAQDVGALVSHVRNPQLVANMLTKYCLALMQNVDDKTLAEIESAIGEIIRDKTLPEEIRMDLVALRLGVVVGPDVVGAAVEALGDRLNAQLPLVVPAAAPAPTPAPTPTPAPAPAGQTGTSDAKAAPDAAATDTTATDPAKTDATASPEPRAVPGSTAGTGDVADQTDTTDNRQDDATTAAAASDGSTGTAQDNVPTPAPDTTAPDTTKVVDPDTDDRGIAVANPGVDRVKAAIETGGTPPKP